MRFFKSEKKPEAEKRKFDIAYENLAIPEIHTGEAEAPEQAPEKPQTETGGYTVEYENLAIPEINPHHRKK